MCTATTCICCRTIMRRASRCCAPACATPTSPTRRCWSTSRSRWTSRSEEHTSELQSRPHLVCRLLLEKKYCTHDNLRRAAQACHDYGELLVRTQSTLHCIHGH